jgi:hypothetical protein
MTKFKPHILDLEISPPDALASRAIAIKIK